MRNLILIRIGFILIATFFAEGLKAQDSSFWSKNDFIVSVGVNYPVITRYKDIYGSDVNFTAHMGINHRFRKSLSFSGNVGLTNMVYGREQTDSNELFTQTIREWYIETPLLLMYNPGENTDFSLYGGLTPSILLFKGISRIPQYPIPPPPEQDDSEPGRFDLALTLGASMHLTKRFILGADYNHSFTSRQNANYNSGRFSTFQAYVGYIINPSIDNSKKSAQANSVDIRYYEPKGLSLLVRLKTEHKRLEYYKNSGNTQAEEKLRAAVKEENSEVIAAFNSAFDYCKVYYFYDSSSRAVADREMQDVLMDGSLNKIEGGSFDTSNFLIAEFGSPYSETFQATSGYGLVVYDKYFRQMQEPFPYYISNYYGILGKQEVISKFNGRLKKFIASYGKY